MKIEIEYGFEKDIIFAKMDGVLNNYKVSNNCFYLEELESLKNAVVTDDFKVIEVSYKIPSLKLPYIVSYKNNDIKVNYNQEFDEIIVNPTLYVKRANIVTFEFKTKKDLTKNYIFLFFELSKIKEFNNLINYLLKLGLKENEIATEAKRVFGKFLSGKYDIIKLKK